MCSRESISEAKGSVPANSGAHLVSRGNTAVHKYRLRARAMSVALRAAWRKTDGEYVIDCKHLQNIGTI